MIRFNEDDPNDYEVIMQLKDNLDICDASVHMLQDKKHDYKELVVCYKTIYINTYDVNVIDLSLCNHKTNSQMPHVIFRHKSFYLWESGITGLLLNKNNDFVTISRDGISVLALGSINNRTFLASDKERIMLHSLESLSYLKIDPTQNCIQF